MSEMKHTSGPWGLRDNANALTPEVSILNDRGYKVAGVGRMVDALLIAAAPELLEVLNKICPLFSVLRCHIPGPSLDALEKEARAAIRRAEGVEGIEGE